MRCNVALWDRWIRFFFGTLLMIWAFVGGPFWSYFGLYLLVSSGWGYCVIYTILKLNTAGDEEQKRNEIP